MRLMRTLVVAAAVVSVWTLAGCGKRASLLLPDRRAESAVQNLGADEAVARAQDRAQQEKSAAAYTFLAHTYALAGRPKDAREALDQALQADPVFPAAAAMKAQLLLNDGRAPAAEKLCRALLEKHPDVVEGYEILGRSLQSQHKLAEAVTALQDGLKRLHREPTLYWALGDALGEQRQYDQAKQAFVRALRLDRHTAELRLAYAQVLMNSGDKERAARVSLQAVALRPNSPQVRFLAGTHLYEAGQATDAIAQYKEALVLDPNNAASANNLALILADLQQETSTAVSWARKAAIASPHSLAVGDTLGWALARDGQYKEGGEVLAKVYKLWPGNPAVQYHYGWTLAKAGKRAEGLALVQKASVSKREDIVPLAQKALTELSH